ncbi:MAG: hypothetical protein AB7W59_08050 [Acidimicrobiia bacterium]
MLVFPRGNRFVQPEWLASIPVVDSYRIPGIALAVCVGAPAIAAGVGLAQGDQSRRPHRLERRGNYHWSRRATQLSGLALLAWLAIELAVIPGRSPIEAIYIAIGASLVTLPSWRSFRACTINGEGPQ